MPKRILKIAKSLKQLGEIQVVEWDFMALLNKDIGDLEVTRSLRRVGNIKVMEWDFKIAFPTVDRHQIAADLRKLLQALIGWGLLAAA